MRRRSVQYRVGLLVCGTLAVFAGLVLFILGSAFDSVATRYYIRFEENVKGMVIGSKVNFQGVPIGSVSDMAFVNGKTTVEITVDPRKAEIQDVTRARLDRLLVTGQVTVELEGYAPGAVALLPESAIEPKFDPLNRLKTSLPEVADRLATTLEHVDALLLAIGEMTNAENRARVASILAQAEQASRTLPPQISELLASLDREADAMGALTTDAREALANVGGAEARDAIAALHRAADGMLAVEQRIADAATEATALLGGLRNPLQTALLAAREALRDVRGLARKLQLAPTSLLFGVEESEIEIPAQPGGSR